MLMFAYGSNLDTLQMRLRCPRATPLVAARLDGYRLRFASRPGGFADEGVATLRREKGVAVEGGLYTVPDREAVRLDRMEGVPFIYAREQVLVREEGEKRGGGRTLAWAYRLVEETPDCAPRGEYLRRVKRGYREWKLDERGLREAVASARCGMKHKLFVYGTLLSGEPNHRLLEGARRVGGGLAGPGCRLFNLGAFPGCVYRYGRSGEVRGEVWEVESDCMARLDHLEGVPHLYLRESIGVRLDDGEAVEAWIYILNREERGLRYIPDGDWRGVAQARRVGRR